MRDRSSDAVTGTPSPFTTSTRHSTAVTASCNAGARSTSGSAPMTAMPSGNASLSSSGNASRSTSRTNSRSRYSPSLSWPVESARPKLTFGWGEKPSLNASGSSVMRNARSIARATSRCEIQRTLPCFVYRSRTGKPVSPRTQARTPRFGTEEADRDAAPRRPGPGRFPGSRPPGRPATPPRARGRSRCTPRSRSTASTGNRGARARPGPLASPARGSPCADRR